MSNPRLARFLPAILGFVLGVTFCFLVYVSHRMLPPLESVDWAEEQRANSPDGRFDAVLFREGLDDKQGRTNWYLYVVEKGQRGPFDKKYALLCASALKGQQLIWLSPNVVLFQYDAAEIQHFKNFWDAVDPPTVDPSGKPEYFIEIRLAARTSSH
jgi:hypothetical protein